MISNKLLSRSSYLTIWIFQWTKIIFEGSSSKLDSMQFMYDKRIQIKISLNECLLLAEAVSKRENKKDGGKFNLLTFDIL